MAMVIPADLKALAIVEYPGGRIEYRRTLLAGTHSSPVKVLGPKCTNAYTSCLRCQAYCRSLGTTDASFSSNAFSSAAWAANMVVPAINCAITNNSNLVPCFSLASLFGESLRRGQRLRWFAEHRELDDPQWRGPGPIRQGQSDEAALHRGDLFKNRVS